MGKQRKYTNAIVAAAILGLLILGLLYTSTSQILPIIPASLEKQQIGDATVSQLPRASTIILFPRDYPVNDRQGLERIYEGELGRILPPSDKDEYFVGKYVPKSISRQDSKNPLPLTQEIINKTYTSTKFWVFAEYGDSGHGANQCEKSRYQVDVDVSMPQILDIYLHETIDRFFHSPLYQEYADVFRDHSLGRQLKSRTTHEYWARFGGSGVYLEQYGVHFVVLRLVYSARKERGVPTISFVLGEVYDQNWNFIPDVQLVVPSNDPEEDHDKSFADPPHNDALGSSRIAYRVVDASSVLAVPIFQRMKTVDGKVYGPEDPRILLVTNKHGHEEPLIVFNEMHRKQVKIEETNIDEPKMGFRRFRSMFQCFPWQVQRGKLNVDGLPLKDAVDDDHDGKAAAHAKLYVRTVEMRISGEERPRIQKNWTPFVSAGDKEIYGHDQYLYVVYRWTDFEVLRCTMSKTESGTSDCLFVYRSITDKPITDGPGPFRGGTALVSVNSFLKSNIQDFPQVRSLLASLKESKREVWVGFARAHLDRCGCGDAAFYRPNFVIVTREFDGRFVLTHVGLSAPLNIPMMGWDLRNPDKLCPGGLPTSVLIPNLISYWAFHNATADNEMPQDHMALALSISDANNLVVHIRGLFNKILEMDTAAKGDVQIFNTAGVREPRKPKNEPLECAISGSKDFCAKFGEENK